MPISTAKEVPYDIFIVQFRASPYMSRAKLYLLIPQMVGLWYNIAFKQKRK